MKKTIRTVTIALGISFCFGVLFASVGSLLPDAYAQSEWRDIIINASDIPANGATTPISLSDQASIIFVAHDQKAAWMQVLGENVQQQFFERKTLVKITITKMEKSVDTPQGRIENYKITIYRKGDLLRGIQELKFGSISIPELGKKLGDYARDIIENLVGFLEARDIHCNVTVGMGSKTVSLSCGHQL